MSKHSGTRAARPVVRVSRQQLLVLAGGITATLVTWGVLVFAAIEFGKQARTGSGFDWALLALATLGAAACLFLTLLLGTKAVEVLLGRGKAETAASTSPARAPGGRRAAR